MLTGDLTLMHLRYGSRTMVYITHMNHYITHMNRVHQLRVHHSNWMLISDHTLFFWICGIWHMDQHHRSYHTHETHIHELCVHHSIRLLISDLSHANWTCGSSTGWQKSIGCFIFVGHFPHKSPRISGTFSKSDLQLKASYGSSPPCTTVDMTRMHHTFTNCPTPQRPDTHQPSLWCTRNSCVLFVRVLWIMLTCVFVRVVHVTWIILTRTTHTNCAYITDLADEHV